MSTAAVAVIWPLPFERFSLAILSPSDPLIALPLLIGIPWLTSCRDKKSQQKRRKILKWSLGLSLFYLLSCLSVKLKVTGDMQAHITTQERLKILPTRHNSVFWRVLAHRGDEIRVAHRSLFQRQATPVVWITYPTGVAAAEPYSGERELQRIQKNTDGFWIARSHRRGLWVADLRAGEILQLGNRGTHVDLRMRRAWNFEPEAPKDRLIAAHAESQSLWQEISESTRGDNRFLEHTPRLAGVPGRFPEPLSVGE
jgi:hypothetical protein